MRYWLCCVGVPQRDVPALHAMIDGARDITRRTFLKYVDWGSLDRLAASLGYADHPARGLTLAADWHVSYHKSNWQGCPCVYLRHSAIEYIFVDE